MDAETCEEVEVIGWLYQFYISEKKDEVFASKKKVSAENIPAATQLFTPNWIVRYLVENSLGRLWMLNNPDSRLKDKMDYYIEPEQQEEDFLRVSSPEELRICDPAVGSGHMLVYAFDLLVAIYEERGYQPSSIPALILEHNLYGIEIDERAGALAAFALTMKARGKSRRFFRNPTQPNILVMENINFKGKRRDTLKDYIEAVGKNLFTFNLDLTLEQFEDATHFGSLIRPELKDVRTVLDSLRGRDDLRDDMFYGQIHNDVLKLLEMVDYLSGKYHVVVANPPYMGSRQMNSQVKELLKLEYKDFKSDLFAAFVVRLLEMVDSGGFAGMMTPFTWMFISSYQKLRDHILDQYRLTSLIQPEYHAFFDSAFVPICTFTLYTKPNQDSRGAFIQLEDFYGADRQPVATLDAVRYSDECDYFYRASSADFKKIPGSPIAYWVSDTIRNTFQESTPFHTVATPRAGMITGNNERFLRYWFEIAINKIGFGFENRHSASESYKVWFPYQKGGGYRKWHGNWDYMVIWENDGYLLRTTIDDRGKVPAHAFNDDYIFRANVNWGQITSSNFSARITLGGALFDSASPSAFPENKAQVYLLAGLLNSYVIRSLLEAINPTLNFQAWNIGYLPILDQISNLSSKINHVVEDLYNKSVIDWDSYETSWDFTDLPLLRSEHHGITLADTYANLRGAWREMTLDMQRLEEENNRIFIEAYGLGDELTPDVPLSEITLTCNPHYRYDSKSSEEKLEARLLEDTMKEFISYAVGCMFGRYALEKDGLILANQGETRTDYDRKVPDSAFPADADNVIPILTENWFEDDIVERFGQFLRLTFGADHYEENLRFIEEAIGSSIRDYFLRGGRGKNKSDFYEDHVKTYNKRPIYWLFASENNAFCALIYMHRYQPDTASVILNEYLREYRSKLEARVAFLDGQTTSASVSPADKTQALKDIEKYKAIIKELNEYERDVLYPLATEQRPMDLDDGVKVNYEAFGAALYEVKGLNK